MGGACSAGRVRVRVRAADLVPSPEVASAAGTRQKLGRCACAGGQFLIVVELLSEHLLLFQHKTAQAREIGFGVNIYLGSSISLDCCCCSELLQSLPVKAASVQLLGHVHIAMLL